MRIDELFEPALTEAAIPPVSPQQALDGKMWGPFYHGSGRALDDILSNGFDIERSIPYGIGRFDRPVGTANGFPLEAKAGGISAPIHMLGFGVYGTTVKAIAKQFNHDSTKGLRPFYLDSQNVLEINFGSYNTMMRWWRQHGYDMTAEATQRRDFRAWSQATKNLSDTLSRQYDAVYFKGKGIYKLLDGDQICVYRPELIRVVDPKLATGLEVGAKVMHTGARHDYGKRSNELYVDELRPTDFGNVGKLGPGWKGIFKAVDHDGKDIPRAGVTVGDRLIGNYPIHLLPPPGMVGMIVDVRQHGDNVMYDVKWSKGGVQHNYQPQELKPAK